MYRSKELGRNTYQFLDADLAERRLRQHTLETRAAHRAVKDGALQAALPAGRAHRRPRDRRRRGAAALDTTPSTATSPPQVFIPLAEESGLIHVARRLGAADRRRAVRGVAQGRAAADGVGQSVRRASSIARTWRSAFPTSCATPAASRRGSSSRSPRRACCTTSTRSARCCTSCATKASPSRSTISAPATRQLTHLKHFPIDTLKIDISFIADLETDPGDAAITEAIIGLARGLGSQGRRRRRRHAASSSTSSTRAAATASRASG